MQGKYGEFFLGGMQRNWGVPDISGDLVSPEAYDLYQRLLNQEEEERDALNGDDARVRDLLLEQQPERHTSPRDSG